VGLSEANAPGGEPCGAICKVEIAPMSNFLAALDEIYALATNTPGAKLPSHCLPAYDPLGQWYCPKTRQWVDSIDLHLARKHNCPVRMGLILEKVLGFNPFPPHLLPSTIGHRHIIPDSQPPPPGGSIEPPRKRITSTQTTLRTLP